MNVHTDHLMGYKSLDCHINISLYPCPVNTETTQIFTMKLLILLLLSGLVSAAPKGDAKPDKGMIQIMVQCLAENWKKGKVEDCFSCFEGLENAKTPEEGLNAGKKCVKDHLPRADKVSSKQYTKPICILIDLKKWGSLNKN